MSELNFTKSSGRIVKEDGSYVNIGDLYDSMLQLNNQTTNTLNSINDLTIKMSNILDTAVEPISEGFKNINTDHGAIHQGFGYIANLYTDSLNQGSKKIFRIKAPTTLYAHLKSIQISSEGASIKVSIIKDCTIDNLGTELDTLTNLNHNSNIPAQSKFYENATYTGGNVWTQLVIHGDTSGVGATLNRPRTNGEFIQNDYLEFVTKKDDENYIIEVENIDVKDNPAVEILIFVFFYEESEGFY